MKTITRFRTGDPARDLARDLTEAAVNQAISPLASGYYADGARHGANVAINGVTEQLDRLPKWRLWLVDRLIN